MVPPTMFLDPLTLLEIQPPLKCDDEKEHEIEEMKKSIGAHLLRSQEKEAVASKEIEEMKKLQDRLTLEKAKIWYDRERLEKVVSVAC